MRKQFYLCGLLLLTACRPEPSAPGPATAPPLPVSRVLKGQVFITMNNGQASKLAGVEIFALKTSDARQHMDAARLRSQDALAELERTMKAERAKVDALESETARAKVAVSNGYANTANLPPRVSAAAVGPLEDRLIEAQKKELAARDLFAKRLDGLRSQHRTNSPSWHAWQQPWPSALATTVTDADGNYELQLPPGEVVLAATAGRKLLRIEEDYFWLVTVPANHQGTMHLSSQNQMRE